MEIGVCVKRVPMVGGKIVLTPDEQEVDTRLSGFTISPHEECAVEEAVQITERLGGTVYVLTLGPIATAEAIVAEVRRHAADGPGYDLLLCGNEAADTGDYQVGIRVACALGWPCVTGIKSLEITEIDGSGLGPVTEERGPEPPGGSGPSGSGVSPGNTVPPRASIATARARREYRGGEEAFEFGLPAVICVKEGINLPRYPSLPGRLRAKRATIERDEPQWRDDGLRKRILRVPATQRKQATVLGTGADGVPALVGVLEEWGLLP